MYMHLYVKAGRPPGRLLHLCTSHCCCSLLLLVLVKPVGNELKPAGLAAGPARPVSAQQAASQHLQALDYINSGSHGLHHRPSVKS